MMEILTDTKRKILRKVFGLLSLSSTLFVFQACYGTPQDMGEDVYIQGVVRSKSTDLPISGIKVSIENQPQYEITDEVGVFQLYTSREAEYKVKFEDVDLTKNGSFLPKDTVVQIGNKYTVLNVSLDVN